MQVGRPQEALATLRRALELQPDYPGVRKNLGLALMQVGRPQEAVPTLRRALELQPNDPEVQRGLGFALMQVGRPQEAVATFRRALELQPDDPEVHHNLAIAFKIVGQPREAVGEFREALRIRPDWPLALGELAWLQATSADATVRDPSEALRLASRAADLSGGHDASILDTLAAAYAEAGRFAEATRIADAAEALADGSAPDLAAEIRGRLSLYRAGQPFRSGR